MIESVVFQGEVYPALQSEGFAAQYAIPFAKKVLRNNQTVFDVGCNRPEWAYPNSFLIDPVLNEYNAMNFPKDIRPDAVFSSHFLEHYNGSWVDVLEYWQKQLCVSGIVFLYLPHYNQKYWHSWHNKKHIHNFTPQMLKDYFMQSGGWTNIFVTEGYDLNHSFYAIAEKSIFANIKEK